MIFAMPLPMLRKLNVPGKQRILLMGIFSFCFFICCITIARLAYQLRTPTDAATDPDFTFPPADLSYWNVIEVNLGLVIACLVTQRPLAAHILPCWFGASLSQDRLASGPQLAMQTIGSGAGGTKQSSDRTPRAVEMTNYEDNKWLELRPRGRSPSNT